MYSIEKLHLILQVTNARDSKLPTLLMDLSSYPGRSFTEFIVLRVQKGLPEINRYSSISQVLDILKG